MKVVSQKSARTLSYKPDGWVALSYDVLKDVSAMNSPEFAGEHAEIALQPDGQLRAEECALVEGVLAGNRKAIGDMVERYSDVVYRFLVQRLDRAEVVDDLVQEVFLAGWRNLSRFRQDSTLGTWLCAIARNKVADYYRERVHELIPSCDEEGELPEALVGNLNLEGEIDRERVAHKIDGILCLMPESYRAVLLWRYWDERSLAEMAKLTGKTVKAMERVLARARNEFAGRWNRE